MKLQSDKNFLCGHTDVFVIEELRDIMMFKCPKVYEWNLLCGHKR